MPGEISSVRAAVIKPEVESARSATRCVTPNLTIDSSPDCAGSASDGVAPVVSRFHRSTVSRSTVPSLPAVSAAVGAALRVAPAATPGVAVARHVPRHAGRHFMATRRFPGVLGLWCATAYTGNENADTTVVSPSRSKIHGGIGQCSAIKRRFLQNAWRNKPKPWRKKKTTDS